MKFDNVDREILRHLLEDARKTYTDIAKELSVSPDAFMQMCIQCAWRRVHGAPVAT